MVDLSNIYSKTGKGLRARNTSVSDLSGQAIKVLSLIDGKSKAMTILTQLNSLSEKELAALLSRLEAEGYIRALTTSNVSSDDWALTSNFTPMVVEEFKSEEEIEAEARAKGEQEKQEAARIAAEKVNEKLRWKAEIEARKEAEQIRLKAEAETERKAKADAKAKLVAEQKARAVAKENARREIERINRETALVQQQKIAQEKAQQKALEEAQKAASIKEAVEKARIAAEQEAARLESERIALKAAQQKAADAKQKAEEEAKEKAERRLKAELAEKAKQVEQEAQRKAKADNDAQLAAARQAKAAQKAQEAAELARLKQLEKEQADAAANEQARLEMANIVRKAEEERKLAEAAANEARQEAKRKTKADELARTKAQRKAKQELEQAQIDAEIAEKNKIELDKLNQAKLNQAKLNQEKLASENAALAETERIASEAATHSKTTQNEEIIAEQVRQQAKQQAIVDEEKRLALQEKAEQIRAKAEAEEQAAIEAKKLAQQEMARIAREADAMRAQGDNTLTKPTLSKSNLDKETKTKFAKNRFDQSKFEKPSANKGKPAKTNTTNFNDTQNFEDSYSELENKAAKNAQIKAKNAAAIAARNAENRQNQIGKWSKFTTRIKSKTSIITGGKLLARLLKFSLIYGSLLAIICVVALHFINISPLIAPIQKLASESVGKPVTIKEVHASLWPQPHLLLSDVVINNSLKVASIQAIVDTSTLFDDVKRVQIITLSGLTIEQNNVDNSLQLLQQFGNSTALKIDQLGVSDLRFKLNDLVLESLAGKLILNEEKLLNTMDLHSADNHLLLQIKPQHLQQNGQYDLSLTGRRWALPFNSNIIFDELNAEGVIAQNNISFSTIKGTMHGGIMQAKCTLDWTGGWKSAGNFTLSNANTKQLLSAFASSASIDGKANLTGTFTAQSNTANTLLAKPSIVASVKVRNGKINNVDLTHAVMFSESASLKGDATAFDLLTANLQVKNGQYQYKQISLSTKQFQANGDINIDQNQSIFGRVNASLVAQSRRLQAKFDLTGSIDNVKKR